VAARPPHLLLLLIAIGGCRSDADDEADADGAKRSTVPAYHEAKYALDALPRAVSTADCPEPALREFSGAALRFAPPVLVVEPFRQRLLELEGVVRDAALHVYGREPTTILVAASYGCRSVSGKKRRLSEHAFGNAIDVSGFRFAAAPEGRLRSARRTPGLEGAFEVSVREHWKAHGDATVRAHAQFLDRLTQELLARDTFRTLLGPAHPGHADHFHFDMAPQHYVDL
jgi:hypothetical protein